MGALWEYVAEQWRTKSVEWTYVHAYMFVHTCARWVSFKTDRRRETIMFRFQIDACQVSPFTLLFFEPKSLFTSHSVAPSPITGAETVNLLPCPCSWCRFSASYTPIDFPTLTTRLKCQSRCLLSRIFPFSNTVIMVERTGACLNLLLLIQEVGNLAFTDY